MSDNENKVVQEDEIIGPQLEYIDIINATKIMEAAIERKAFSIKELGEVAQIVSRFQDFCEAILKQQPDSFEEVEANEGE